MRDPQTTFLAIAIVFGGFTFRANEAGTGRRSRILSSLISSDPAAEHATIDVLLELDR